MLRECRQSPVGCFVPVRDARCGGPIWRPKMGLFGTIKEEAQRNFIARADEAKDDIIYKYPERNIRMMTQLTVDSDELALFFKDGQIVGKLGPGRHNLDTNNIPFLSRLLEKLTGGNLFIAEVFFVSTR